MNQQCPPIVAVDFDGTIVEHAYPEIGQPVPEALEWLQAFLAAGAKLILWTMRSSRVDQGGRDCLQEAVAYLSQHGIELYGVNCNPDQRDWTESPKAYAHIYIDDAAAGCPLRESNRAGARPFADWSALGPMVMAHLEAGKAGWAEDAALIAAKQERTTDMTHQAEQIEAEVRELRCRADASWTFVVGGLAIALGEGVLASFVSWRAANGPRTFAFLCSLALAGLAVAGWFAVRGHRARKRISALTIEAKET